MFILIMATTLYQSLNTFEEKNAELEAQKVTIQEQETDLLEKKAETEEQQRLLEEQKTTLEEQKTTLEEQKSQLDAQQKTLEEQTSQMELQQTTLEEQKSKLEEQQATLEKQQTQLEDQQETLEEQQMLLAKQEGTLKQQEEQLSQKEESLNSTTQQLEELSNIIGVKEDIIGTLSDEFSKSDLSVQVDNTSGAITFDSSVVFAFNSYTLTDDGKQFLTEFIPKYISILLDSDYRDYVSEIIIEGHTDTVGQYIYNLNLSQQRASAVAEYILDEKMSPLEMDEIDVLRKLVTSNGRSFSDPILNTNGEVDMDASRRVVFKFRVKDEEMIREMQRILETRND